MGQFSPAERARVNDLLADALELPPEERVEFVKSQGDEPPIEEEVLRLLEQVAASTQAFHGPQDRGPRAGQTVGQFRLLQMLGQGASGEVYLAVRLDIGQRAAVKILRAAITDAHSEKRFEQEARLLAGLDHPNIVKLLDYGHLPDGWPYLAMEYVGGGSLRSWCDKQRLTVKERIVLFLKICDAVRYAHEQLLVHRDLKPENILIDVQGEPKLVDFGLVRVLGLIPTLTTNTLLDVEIQQSIGGTFEYASPEQLEGGPISTASDVYGLGSVLYELLAGRVPLKIGETGRETAMDFIRRVRNEAPPKISHVALTEEVGVLRRSTVAQLRRALNDDLDAILEKALSKTAAARYGNAKEFADDLERYLNLEPVSPRSGDIGYRLRLFVHRRRYLLTAAAVLVMAAIGAGAEILAQNARLRAANNELRAANNEKTHTMASIMEAAISLEKGIEGSQRSGEPNQARAAMETADARLKADPTPDAKFHAARCRRLLAELLLHSSNTSQRIEGQKLLKRAESLLSDINSADPDYGGLDGEQEEVDAIEKELSSGMWTTAGTGFAAELAPPTLSSSAESLDDARVERNLGDLWMSMDDKPHAAAEYERALTSYDASGYVSSDPRLAAERAECAKRLGEAKKR